MDAAATTRRAARAAVADVNPARLRSVLREELAARSMAPGALALASRRAVGTGDGTSDGAAERAAGVQLIYEGLWLTRRLVAEDPWAGAGEDDIPADVDVLAADVFVARGFRLLARTEVADHAVEVVREFGRDQTDVGAGRRTPSSALEASVFELAVAAGASAGGRSVPDRLRRYAAELGREQALPLGGVGEALPAELEAELVRRVAGPDPGQDSPTPARSANRND